MEYHLNVQHEKGGFMKLKLYTFTLIAVLSMAGFACKTASKLYEKGNYDEAVELAAKKLQKDPNDPKLLDIIRNSYSYAVNDHENRIRTDAESNNELKWEWMYYEYASLQKMYDAIYKVPAVFQIVRPVDYSSYLVTYAEKAGNTRYERGISFMQRSDKKSYQAAYREFQAALKFIPGDRDAMQKMNEAYEYAVTNVVILPMQQQGGFVYSSYNVGGENFDDRLIRNLQYNSGNEFVKFYSAWDARNRNIRVDQEVDMHLATVNIGRYYDNRSTRRVSKEIVVKEIVYKPDSVVKQYAKVYADITTTRRTMNSNAILQVTVRDQDGQWLWSDDFNGDHSWNTEFSTFTGDERALSDADKQLINRRREFAPTESEIMRCILDDINNNAQYRIKNYFNRF
jgi:tetratricopeptide (TPR) repeat protein